MYIKEYLHSFNDKSKEILCNVMKSLMLIDKRKRESYESTTRAKSNKRLIKSPEYPLVFPSRSPPECWLDLPPWIHRMVITSHLALSVNSSANFIVYVAVGTKFQKAFIRIKDSLRRKSNLMMRRTQRLVYVLDQYLLRNENLLLCVLTRRFESYNILVCVNKKGR